jgi:hypothetical protein
MPLHNPHPSTETSYGRNPLPQRAGEGLSDRRTTVPQGGFALRPYGIRTLGTTTLRHCAEEAARSVATLTTTISTTTPSQ